MFYIFHTEDIVYLVSREIKSLERERVYAEGKHRQINIQSAGCRFCCGWTFSSGQSRILFFLGCVMYLCATDQWSRETDHIAFARTECVCFLCSPFKLISAGSWCWLSSQGDHTKLITLSNLKEKIFTEKIPSIL